MIPRCSRSIFSPIATKIKPPNDSTLFSLLDQSAIVVHIIHVQKPRLMVRAEQAKEALADVEAVLKNIGLIADSLP